MLSLCPGDDFMADILLERAVQENNPARQLSGTQLLNMLGFGAVQTTQLQGYAGCGWQRPGVVRGVVAWLI
jgi:hypothetical protein